MDGKEGIIENKLNSFQAQQINKLKYKLEFEKFNNFFYVLYLCAGAKVIIIA